MDEEVLKFIIPVLTGAAGLVVKTGYDKYLKKTDKKLRAELMDKLYTDLEAMYAKDLELQKELHLKSEENEKLKMIIKKWEDGSSETI